MNESEVIRWFLTEPYVNAKDEARQGNYVLSGMLLFSQVAFYIALVVLAVLWVPMAILGYLLARLATERPEVLEAQDD